MVRTVLAVAAIGFTAGFGIANGPDDGDDLRALQGNWKPSVVRYEGKDQAPAAALKQMTGVYDGNEFHLYYIDLGREGPRPLKVAVAAFTLSPSATPKALEFEFARGPLKGRRLHGIYELTGDRLKLCYGPADKPRPSSYDAPAGSGHFSEEWQRKQK